MKYLKRLTILSGLLTLGIGHLGAQTAAPNPDSEEVIELTPFEVDSSSDVGYRATSTVSGSRLNTQLRDVAASVAILTSEFLDDIGANDIETAFAYIAGVETALNTDTAERGGSGELQDSVTNTQPGNNRVRGLSRADVTRDFFEIGNANLDRYNIERIALVRGPNSILFGLGSPAGIINYTTKKATLGRDINEVSLGVDNYGSYRTTFDFNRAFNDKLALRVMVLTEDTKSQFDTSFDKDDRVTASLLFQPFSSTSISYSFETTQNDARRPNYSLPIDNISHWIASGRPTWDIRDPNNVGVNPASNFPGGPTNSTNPASPSTLNGGVEEFNNPFGFTNIQLFLPDSSDPTVPFITTKASVGFRTGGEVNQVQDFTLRTLARSRSAFDQVDNFTNTSVTDPRIFPIYDMNLAALPGNRQLRDSDTHHITLRQRILKGLHLELSSFQDTTTNANTSRFDGSDRAVSIDLNPVLLDGVTTNPGYLRPYISGRGGYGESERTNEAFRGTLAYDFDFEDFSDRLGFLGRHVISGVYYDSSTDDFSANGSPSSAIQTTDQETFGLSKTIYGSWVFQNWYLGDPFTADQQFPNYTVSTTQEIDPRTPITVYRPTNGASVNDPLIWSNANAVPTGRLYSRANWSELEVEGQGFTWQGYLWGDRIAATWGVREDTVASLSANQVSDDSSEVDPLNPQSWGRALANPEPAQTGQTSTKGIVFHPFQWLSVFYNESDNFAVGPTRVYPTLDAIPNSSGEGQDIGIVLRTPDNKLELKLNRFETSQKNVSGRGTLAGTARFGVNTYERFAWATIRNFRNNRLNDGTFDNGGTYAFRGQNMDQATFEDFFRYAWYDPAAADKVGPPTESRYFAPPNSDDTVDVDATGYELEVTYNPLPNWRIAFNATSIETIQDNIGPGFNEYVQARLPIWSKTWGDLTLDGDGNITGAANGIHFQDRSVQRLMYQEYINRVVSAQNTAKAGEGRINVGQSKYSANFITNYAFRTDRLRGISVGANVRWREGSTVGYPILQTADGPVSDLANPFIADPDLNLGLNVSYRKKIWDDKIDWITRLQINNVIGDDKVELSVVNPDGTPAGFRVGRERYFQWSNTFRF